MGCIIAIVLYLIALLVLGVLVGILSGLIGIGGGILIVPALIFMFGFSQHQAQGTTLALLVLPVGSLAAFTYYRNGNVNIKAAILIALGFVVGGLIGAKFAGNLPDKTLARIFGSVLIVVGIRSLF